MFTQATLRCSLITNHRARGGGSMTRYPFHDLLRDLPPELQRAFTTASTSADPTSPRAPTPATGTRNSTTRLPTPPASPRRPMTLTAAARSISGACA
jgi:hypothetical protein